jgi:hypothetical protein
MDRRRCFLLGVVFILLLSAADLVLTWIITPDLSDEANTFVVLYGFGWVELVLVRIGFICFVIIPFYYHCYVFNYPEYIIKKPPIKNILLGYFFHNQKNQFLSFLSAIFNILGFYLFWKYIVEKTGAVIHNLLNILAVSFFNLNDLSNKEGYNSNYHSGSWGRQIVERYWNLEFNDQVNLLNRIQVVILIIVMLIFFVSIIYKARKNVKRKTNTQRIHIAFIIFFISLYLSFKLFLILKKPIQKYYVELTNQVDPDIVLFNIEDGDRSFIGRMILAIDSCKPSLIAINSFFKNEKNIAEDSILEKALKITQNDILIYHVDLRGRHTNSAKKFDSLATTSGLNSIDIIDGLASHFTPIKNINGEIHESFALQIIKLWKPGFKFETRPNKQIPIKFNRTLKQYFSFDVSELNKTEVRDLIKNKVVLIGYLGPSNEDKHFTPIRLLSSFYGDDPDTYGTVIIANEIRTILDR